MKYIMKLLAYLICYLIYPFSFFIPRSKKKVAFGSFRGAFNDNSKYLFIYMAEHVADKQICWLSINRKTVQLVRSLHLPAAWIFSPRGMWYALRSKIWFVNSYTSDIMFCLSGGATVVNLWHGLGLKCCEFNITRGELAKRYVDHEFKEVFTHPECFRSPDYVLVTKPFQSSMFEKAFRITDQQCIDEGYPRNTILTGSQEAALRFVDKYEPHSTRQIIDDLAAFDKVYMYMPTWRDSQKEVFIEHFNMDELEATLAKQNAIMLLKPHANTTAKNIVETKHIRFIPSNIDVYGILPFTDVLITDYSSILYDYILMDKKDVILYIYDYDEYVKDRDFYYPFKENVCGKRIYDWTSLIDCIDKQNYTLASTEREYIINKFWGHTMDANQDVCANIINSIFQHADTKTER